jgi:hypothetical protein
MPSNPFIFPVPMPGASYSRFGTGEFGSNTNNATQTGMASMPEGSFQVAPGSPIPTAFFPNIGNQLGPGITKDLIKSEANQNAS